MVHTELAVSIIFLVLAIMMLLAALISTVIFRKFRRTTIAKTGFLILAIIFFLFLFVTRIAELAIFETIRTWFEIILLITLSLFVRDFAKARNLGEEEGARYKYLNIGILLGPLIGGFLAIRFGYEFVFILASLIMIYGLAYFYHKHVIEKHPAIINSKTTSSNPIIHNIKHFFKDTDRTKAFMVTLSFMLWVGFKRIYIPLYVILSGYLESVSGIILSLSILPLILLEEKVGEYSDKKGMKLPIFAGFLIMAIFLLGIFASPFTILNFGMLVLVNIGAALIEPLQEVLVFKHITEKEEEDLFGIYMTADPVAFFLTSGIGLIVLLFLPFKFLFLVFGIIMLTTSIFAKIILKHS